MKWIVVDENGEEVDGTETYRDKRRAEKDANKWTQNRDGEYEVQLLGENKEVKRAAMKFGPGGTVENSEANKADSETTTMNYPVSNGDDEAQTQNNDDNQQTLGSQFDWGYGSHSTASDESMNQLGGAIRETIQDLDDDVDGEMLAVLEDASELVGKIEVNDFECPHPDCGLSHGHGPHKHDIRNDTDCVGVEGFNITDEFADQMHFEANCHCGANEAAMLMPFLPYMNIPMFDDQEQFEAVFEIDPEALNQIYRTAQEVDASVSIAVGRVASQRGVIEYEMAPLGLRDDLEAYVQRRRKVESGADDAPIGEETRSVINENREELEEATSE